jgi:hypothetical protein
VLYQVVRDHFDTFRAEGARVYERDALPRFIEEEFQGSEAMSRTHTRSRGTKVSQHRTQYRGAAAAD